MFMFVEIDATLASSLKIRKTKCFRFHNLPVHHFIERVRMHVHVNLCNMCNS